MQKKLVDKLVEVSPENISEIKMVEITLAEHENEYENVCKSSCTVYIMLFSIIVAINIGISTYFIYDIYINLS